MNTSNGTSLVTAGAGERCVLPSRRSAVWAVIFSGSVRISGRVLEAVSLHVTAERRGERSLTILADNTLLITGSLSLTDCGQLAPPDYLPYSGPFFQSPARALEKARSLQKEAAQNPLQERLFQLEMEGAVIEQLLLVQQRALAINPLVQDAREYFEKHFTSNIHLQSLARTLGVSREQLIRMFRAETGVTPMRYYRELRISMADELINQGNSVKETSWKLGFSSPSHFSRVYKAVRGRSPNEGRVSSCATLPQF